MLGTPAVFSILSLCLLCFSLCFFFLVLSLFGFLPGSVSGLLTLPSLLSLGLQVCLFIKPAEELQNPSSAESFGLSTEGTWWDLCSLTGPCRPQPLPRGSCWSCPCRALLILP